MSESLENQIKEPDFPIPENASVINSEGKEKFGIKDYRHSELQFVVSQLASLVMPVSPISRLEDGSYVSIDASEHQNYNDKRFNNEVELRANAIFMDSIFNDWDHGIVSDKENKNIDKGVFYDFHVADLAMKSNPPSLLKYAYKTSEIKEKVINSLSEKLFYFRSQIEGESGLRFIDSLLKKAGEGRGLMLSASEIQDNLLRRCNQTLRKLN